MPLVKGHKRSPSEVKFQDINEQHVEDITLEFFYKPHTLSLLAFSVLTLIYFAFTRDDENSLEDNIWHGLCCIALFFLILSLLTFPNGPFTRPHPAVWRIVFGVSVMYLLALGFTLFQSIKDVKAILIWFYPDLKGVGPDTKEYAVNCSTISWERIKEHTDFFALAHFFGWVMKAMLIRHYGICWTISVTWEFTEIVFSHLLPNFMECWWDQLILDVLLCNGLGIWVGMQICKALEMRKFHWESIKDIHSTTGKLYRAALQFTPHSWTRVKWLDPNSSYMRMIAVYILLVVWQVSELNTFFLKHVLLIPTNHPLTIGRIVLIGFIVAPTVRQYYCYVTEPRCKRLGTQAWVFCAITFVEALISIKFGLEMFANAVLLYLILWLCCQMVICMFCVYVMLIMAWSPKYRRIKGSNGSSQNDTWLSDITPENSFGTRNSKRFREASQVKAYLEDITSDEELYTETIRSPRHSKLE